MNLFKKFGIKKGAKPGELLEKARAMNFKVKHKWTEKKDDADDRKHGIKEDSKQDKALDAKRGLKHKTMCKTCGKAHSAGIKHKKAPLGSGKRFAALKGQLGKKGAKNPGALAAFIGRKKYGAKKFGQLSAGGKK